MESWAPRGMRAETWRLARIPEAPCGPLPGRTDIRLRERAWPAAGGGAHPYSGRGRALMPQARPRLVLRPHGARRALKHGHGRDGGDRRTAPHRKDPGPRHAGRAARPRRGTQLEHPRLDRDIRRRQQHRGQDDSCGHGDGRGEDPPEPVAGNRPAAAPAGGGRAGTPVSARRPPKPSGIIWPAGVPGPPARRPCGPASGKGDAAGRARRPPASPRRPSGPTRAQGDGAVTDSARIAP